MKQWLSDIGNQAAQDGSPQDREEEREASLTTSLD